MTNKHLKNIKKFRREIIVSQIVRDLINLMVLDVIKTTKSNLKKINPQSASDIYKQDHLIVDFSKKMKKCGDHFLLRPTYILGQVPKLFNRPCV